MYGSADTANQLLTSAQIQIIESFLDPKVKQTIEKIFLSNDLMYGNLEKLINFEIPMASSVAGSATTAGIALATGTSAGIGIAAIFAIPAFVLGSAVAIGGGVYYGYILHVDHEDYKKSVIKAGRNSAGNIWRTYFKTEYVSEREADIHQYFTLDREHEAINSWFQLRNLRFLTIESAESENTRNQREDNIKSIKIYIKPEYLKSIYRRQDEVVNIEDITQFDIETSRFCHDMRTYCAANKIGEFSQTKPKWNSLQWDKRENLKKKIFSECLIDGKKDIKTFYKIRDQFYRAYRAITYLNAVEHEGAESDLNKKEALKLKSLQLANKLEKFIAERVIPGKRSDFEKLFRTYRYLGGMCEFNPNNIFEMQFFDQYYCSDIFHFQNSPSMTALTVGLSVVYGCLPPPLNLIALTYTYTPSEEIKLSRLQSEREKRAKADPYLNYRSQI